MRNKAIKALVLGCGIGAIVAVLLYRSGLMPLLFFLLATIAVFMGRRAASKGERWRRICYANYGIAVLTLIYGFILI